MYPGSLPIDDLGGLFFNDSLSREYFVWNLERNIKILLNDQRPQTTRIPDTSETTTEIYVPDSTLSSTGSIATIEPPTVEATSKINFSEENEPTSEPQLTGNEAINSNANMVNIMTELFNSGSNMVSFATVEHPNSTPTSLATLKNSQISSLKRFHSSNQENVTSSHLNTEKDSMSKLESSYDNNYLSESQAGAKRNTFLPELEQEINDVWDFYVKVAAV